MEPKISVVVPVYNKGAYVSDTIDSICGQSYKNLEIILVNDGSTDSSGEVCEKKALKDNRIRYVVQPNAGVSAARNKGMDFASGEYLTFVDADDRLIPSAIEKMRNCMETYHADLVVSRQKIISEHTVQITGNIDNSTGVLEQDEFFRSLAGDTIGVFWGSQGNKLYSRKLISEQHLRFEIGRSHAEDFLFNLEYYKLQPKIAFLNEATCEIHDTPASLSKQITENGLIKWGEDVWQAMTLFYLEHHQEKYLPWVNALFCKIVRGLITELHRNGQLSMQRAHETVVSCANVLWIARSIMNARSDGKKQQLAIRLFRAKAYWPLALLYCLSER